MRDWEARATTDPDRIERAWAAGPYNVGVATGPSGLVVVDLDRPKPREVPPPAYRQPGIRDGGDVLAMLCEALDQPLPVDTYAVHTASAGMHLYFTAPAAVTLRNTAKRLGWLIDTRAHGGYVVAAGSLVAGRTYTAIDPDTDPAPLPDWIAERLADPGPSTHALTSAAPGGLAVDRPNAYALAALRGELDRVLTAAEGTRNHTLNTAAFALGQLTAAGLLPHQLAEDALTAAGLAIGLPTREVAATVRSGLDSGERTPRRPGSPPDHYDDRRPAA